MKITFYRAVIYYMAKIMGYNSEQIMKKNIFFNRGNYTS